MIKRNRSLVYWFILGALLILAALLLASSWLPLPAGAQAAVGLTPVAGHSEIHTSFPFLFKTSPEQRGWSSAEFKDERDGQYWKVDALPGCADWLTVPGDTRPGLLLHAGVNSCASFSIAYGFIYVFSSPVTPPVSPPFPTATGTPPTGTAVAGPPSPTPTATRTPAPAGTPIIITTTPISDYRSITMYPYLISGMPYAYCRNDCKELVVGVGPEKFDAIYNLARNTVRDVLLTVTPIK
jgi:hypothetical protein